MQFHSLYFIIFFLPLTLLGYYLPAGKQTGRGKAAADWFLIAASFLFYGIANPRYPAMLAVLILLNWGIAGRENAAEAAGASGRSERWMAFGIVLNVCFLGFFKYTNFFLENLNVFLHQDWPLVHVLLPLGISFIIFSQISFLVDVRRGKIPGVCVVLRVLSEAVTGTDYHDA